MYCARLEYRGFIKDFGEFKNPIDCLEYINHDKQMIVIQWLLNRLDYNLGDCYFNEPVYIHVFDLKQKRYCDSFDF